MRAEHEAIAKAKLAGPGRRTQDLDRLADMLDEGEEVITMADALLRSPGIERRGLAVLTDRRLLCVDNGSFGAQSMAIQRSAITAVESGSSGGMGDARRGELRIVADGVHTQLIRVHPWERAEEIRAAVSESLGVMVAA